MSDCVLTVVMPVWNGEDYLREAIESILSQTFQNFEFLILDDGSTDSTPLILEEYAQRDRRIRVIQLEHEGIVVALNRGVEEARGELIARMDCDDVAYPNRLEEQVALMRNSGAGLCHTHIRIIGDSRWVTPAGRFVRSRSLLALRMCFQCLVIHPTVMFRRDLFVDLGGYLPEERHAEDFGLWGKMLEAGKVEGIAEPLLDFRVHGESISKKKAQTQREVAERISQRHCEMFMNLDKETASRAYDALRGSRRGHPLREWMWFVCRCVPRLRWQSLEMWAWLVSRTLQMLRYPSRFRL